MTIKKNANQDEVVTPIKIPYEIKLTLIKEIFENSNVALFGGLATGLTVSLVALIFFCILYYRIKHKYD